MRQQRGFTLYIVLAALLAFGGVSALAWLQTQRLDACKQESATFRAEVKAKGEAAIAEAKRIDAENKAKQEKINRENKTLRVDNRRINDELLNIRASRGYLPGPAASSRSPDRIAFDRAELESAIQRLDAGVSGIVAAGDADRIDLNSARRWAQ